MKVLLVAPFPPPYGGIANWSNMLSAYMQQTHDELVTLNIAPKKRSTEGRGLFDRVVVSGLDMLKKKSELKKQIKAHHPNVMHMTTSGSLAIIRDILLLRTAKKCGVPTVYHIRYGKTPEMAQRDSFLWKLFKMAMCLAGSVIAIDKATYDAIRQYAPQVNVSLVPNPVNTEKLPYQCKKMRNQVVFLGWVVPTKGVGELIEAWNTVGAEYPDYELLVIGQAKPDYYHEMEKSVKVSNICFAGELEHNKAMEAVAQSQVFILPSYSEGFPNAVVEAMALKKAVIGTSVGAIPEMLGDGCGIIIEPKNVEQIVTALRTVLDNPELRDKLAQNAWNKVQTQYKIETVYAKYREIWNQIEEVIK